MASIGVDLIMRFGFSMVMLAGFVGLAFHYWNRLRQEDEFCQPPGWFVQWVGQGMIAPVLVWLVVNLGILPSFPPLLPEIAIAQSGSGGWAKALFRETAPGILVIGSFWTALTLAWLLAAISVRTVGRSESFGTSAIWGALMAPVALWILWGMGQAAAGLAATVWLLPMVHYALPLVFTKKQAPLYSKAIAKMKFGKYAEAETEVLHELERCADDFAGWMMLADLYANHFDDLPGAERTIQDLCGQPGTTVSQISVALQRLADWQLKVAEDPVAARRSLEEICQRMPGTHLETMARQRIRQLPATREGLQAQRQTRRIRLPGLADNPADEANLAAPEISREAAEARAKQCVEKLKQNPESVAPREELARLWAERLGQPSLALEQMELLLGMPHQSEPKRAEWLALMAGWQIRYRGDEPAARALLDRLVREFPETVQAFAAQRRLNLMNIAEKLRRGRSATVNAKAAP